MSQLLWANNASTTLAVAIGTSTTSIVLAGGTGSFFPDPGPNQYFLGTLSPSTPGTQAPEIVRVNARSIDTLTVVRAREGTSALNWGIGTIFQNLITRGTFEAVPQMETYPGNPNGNVAGAQATTTPPSTVWDTINGLIWVCMTSGPAATAVWAALAPLNSPAFTGNPTVPDPPFADNTSRIANTAFVESRVATRALVDGKSTQVFQVANAISNSHAVNLSQLTAGLAGKANLAGSVSQPFSSSSFTDQKGELRNIPQNAQSSSYTLQFSDVGKHVSISNGGVTVPAGIFSSGNAINVYNDSVNTQTITAAPGVTMYWAITGGTGNRNLFQRGICTILCVRNNEFVISGSGLN